MIIAFKEIMNLNKPACHQFVAHRLVLEILFNCPGLKEECFSALDSQHIFLTIFLDQAP